MRDIRQMLEQLESQLEQRADVNITSVQPETPTAIFYAGRRSLEAQADIEQTLRRVWRARADAVCHFLREQGNYARCSGGKAVLTMSEAEVIDGIEKMFGDDRSFHKLTELFLVQIQDTEQYRNLEEFCQDYQAPNDFADRMDSNTTILKLVLLDESSRGRVLADQIRTFLREEIRSGAGQNRSTVILSNRLQSGQLLLNRMLRENYTLAGNIILIANGFTQGFQAAYPTMFPLNGKEMLTASYSWLPRPNRDICEVMTHIVMEWVWAHFARTEAMSASAVTEQLEINGGIMKTMSEGFRRHVSGGIVGIETLECLPRSVMDLGPIADKPFEQFDKMTMGSFRLFFEQNVLPVCRAEGSIEVFRREFREFVRSKFTPSEAASSLTPQTIDAVLQEVNVSDPPRNLPAYSYMRKLLESQYYAQMLPVCREVLGQINREAKEYISQIKSLIDDFNQNYMLAVDPTVEAYYEPLVRNALNGELGVGLIARLNQEQQAVSGILAAVYDTLVSIVRSNDIFGMSLVEELKKRLGGNQNLMRTKICDELLNPLSERVRLRAPIAPGKCMDVMMLDTDCDVFSFLEDMYPQMYRMNTRNGSTVEMIQFFRVGDTVI